MAKKKPGEHAAPSLSKERLRTLVEKATVDAYGDDEQRVGFFTMLEDNLAVPFETSLLGIPVCVESIELTSVDDIVAMCVRGKERQRIPILDLPLPSPRPEGWEWIEAYRHWVNPT